MASRYRRFLRATLTPGHLAGVRDILHRHGHHAELKGRDLYSTTLPVFLSVDGLPPLEVQRAPDHNVQAAPVYFIETGDDLALDATIDAFFAEVLVEQADATAFCSHCYAHFTPTTKPFEVRESASCTISLPRSNPELAKLCALPEDAYRANFYDPEPPNPDDGGPS